MLKYQCSSTVMHLMQVLKQQEKSLSMLRYDAHWCRNVIFIGGHSVLRGHKATARGRVWEGDVKILGGPCPHSPPQFLCLCWYLTSVWQGWSIEYCQIIATPHFPARCLICKSNALQLVLSITIFHQLISYITGLVSICRAIPWLSEFIISLVVLLAINYAKGRGGGDLESPNSLDVDSFLSKVNIIRDC